MSTQERVRGMGAWLAMARCHTKVEGLLANSVRELDLTLAQHDTLMNLRHQDGLSQQQLAERLLVTKGNLTGMLGRMEGRGWLERRRDPSDARLKRVYLTESGRALAALAFERQRALIEAMVEPHDDTSMQLFRVLLGRLEERLDELRGGDSG